MNIVDALVVTFGIDASEYEKKQKEIATSLTKMGEVSGKQTKLIAESGKKAAGAFSALKIEILGALAAFGMGAGFKSFIESSINGQAQLGRLSASLGVSTHHLQAFKLMAREVGASGDDATNAMQKVMGGLANAKTNGPNALTEASLKYGVNLSYNDNAEQAMLKINKAVYALKQKFGAQVAMQGASALGISGLNMQMMMMESPTEFATHFAHALSLTGAATKASTEQAERLQAQWADLQERFRQVGERVFNKLEPVLARLGETFANWLDHVDWDKVINQVDEFFDKLQQVVQALGGVKGILIEIAAIKVFGWIASIGGWIIQLRSLTTALNAARLASAAGAGAGAIPTAAGPGAAAAGKGFFAKLLGGSLLLRSLWTAAWAPRPEESPEQFKARIDAQNKKFNASHPGYEKSSYWDKWKTVFGLASSPEANASVSASGMIDRTTTDSLFSKLEKQNGLPAGLLSSIYSAESSRGKNLISPKGALGPFQFMPGTASDYGLSGSDVFDTGKSATAAASYLHNLLAQFHGNLPEAIAAYNWGPGNVQRRGMDSLPKETSDYVSKVLGGVSSAYVGAKPTASTSGPHQSTTNSDVHIGTLQVNTKATDANGIAKAIGKSLRSNPLIAGSVTALA
jgi:soluble lytic murein transglycosylase-like protein